MTKSNSLKCQMTKHKIQNKHKAQIPNAKIFILIFVILILNLFCALNFDICHLRFGICHSHAQDNNKLVTLTKQIIEAKTNEELYPLFERLKGIYFQDNKYNDFVDLLRSLMQKKKTLAPYVNYYIALARYSQLKYLQETQNWDEYFSQGNTYRDDITERAKNTIDATTSKDALNINARLLIWQFHKDQQDVFHEQALSELMNSVLEFAKGSPDAKPIKEAADKLSLYGEKGKAKELYKIYAQNIITSDIKDDELKNIALGFYNDGNLELAENFYDAYIEKIAKSEPKEKLVPILIDLAKSFAYKDAQPSDALYAEKVFSKIEELAGKEIFEQEQIYLRAFNLEKAKEYQKAKDIYIDLVNRYPQTLHADEAGFKVGIIYTYILGDAKQGKTFFDKLVQKERPSPQLISSLYQLGLLSQWENDYPGAKDYYNKLIERAADNFSETVALAKERLKEIGEAKPIEYNLKTFLDVSLNPVRNLDVDERNKISNGVKEEYATFDMTKSELRASIYRLNKDQEENITASTYMPESGCLQVELQYLWSGHLGQAKPSLNEPSFNTTYTQAGTKEINLVIISSTGIIDRNIDLVDVD